MCSGQGPFTSTKLARRGRLLHFPRWLTLHPIVKDGDEEKIRMSWERLERNFMIRDGSSLYALHSIDGETADCEKDGNGHMGVIKKASIVEVKYSRAEEPRKV